MIRFSFLFLLAINMLSCASNAPALKQALESAIPCCDNYSEFDYFLITNDQHVSFELNADSPSYVFYNGKSFFKGFSLGKDIASITINSYYSSQYLPSATLFYPIIQILDEDFNSVRVVESNLVQHEDYFRGVFIQVKISKQENEKYIIVHTDPAYLKGTYPHSHSYSNSYMISLPGGGFTTVLAGESEALHDIPYVPGGSIRVITD